ncbi:hypothetical protein [Halocatena halophila]|uniref:hypothetical protein n=1 Tax=Halocatena halophila TaxID=2814576 RepID=UPI002ED2C10E
MEKQTIPTYLTEGIDRQKNPQLEEIAEFIEQLLEWHKGDIANYLTEGIPKQDPETLEAIQEQISEQMERNLEITEDDLPDNAEPVDDELESFDVERDELDIASGSSVYVYSQRRNCNKPHCSCNNGKGHGPYLYAYFRGPDGRLKSKYLSKH